MPWISSSLLTWLSPKTSVRRWILPGKRFLPPTPNGRSVFGWIHSENLCGACRERLYYTTGFGLIQCVKALMSYEDEVIRFPHLPRGRQVNSYEGSDSSISTREAWERGREST